MKIHFSYTLFLGLLCFVVLQGNRSGRATVAGEGVTGAPGDASQSGNIKTCAVSGCHSSTSFAPVTIGITLLDSASLNPVQQYTPGKQHIVRVRVLPGTGSPLGYGFQMIDLKDAGNVAINGFSDPLGMSNNYKLKALPNGRTYAEHQTMSVSNTFDVVWKAPVIGSGSVTFYASGNAVNNNSGNSGDSGGNSKLQVPEGSASSVGEAWEREKIALVVSPNPVTEAAVVQWTLPEGVSGLRMQVLDVQGRQVWEQEAPAGAGDHTQVVPAPTWPPGLYWVVLQNGTHLGAAKLIRL